MKLKKEPRINQFDIEYEFVEYLSEHWNENNDYSL